MKINSVIFIVKTNRTRKKCDLIYTRLWKEIKSRHLYSGKRSRKKKMNLKNWFQNASIIIATIVYGKMKNEKINAITAI